MSFYEQITPVKEAEIARIMTDAAKTFIHPNTAQAYIALYEQMLKRPLVPDVSVVDTDTQG